MKLGAKVELSKYGREKLATLPGNSLPLDSTGVLVGARENSYQIKFNGRDFPTTIKRRFVRLYRGKK